MDFCFFCGKSITGPSYVHNLPVYHINIDDVNANTVPLFAGMDFPYYYWEFAYMDNKCLNPNDPFLKSYCSANCILEITDETNIKSISKKRKIE